MNKKFVLLIFLLLFSFSFVSAGTIVTDRLEAQNISLDINQSGIRFYNDYLDLSLSHLDFFVPTELQDSLVLVTPCDPNIMVCQGDNNFFHVLNDWTNAFGDEFYIETDFLFDYEKPALSIDNVSPFVVYNGSNATLYSVGDVVLYNGDFYECNQQIFNYSGVPSSLMPQYWSVVVDTSGNGVPEGFGFKRINQEIISNYDINNVGLGEIIETGIIIDDYRRIKINVRSKYEVLILDYFYVYNPTGIVGIDTNDWWLNFDNNIKVFEDVFIGEKPFLLVGDGYTKKIENKKPFLQNEYKDMLNVTLDNTYHDSFEGYVTIAYPKNEELLEIDFPNLIEEVPSRYNLVYSKGISINKTNTFPSDTSDYIFHSFRVNVDGFSISDFKYYISSTQKKNNKMFLWIEGSWLGVFGETISESFLYNYYSVDSNLILYGIDEVSGEAVTSWSWERDGAPFSTDQNTSFVLTADTDENIALIVDTNNANTYSYSQILSFGEIVAPNTTFDYVDLGGNDYNLNLLCSDSNSGCSSIYYMIDNNVWVEYSYNLSSVQYDATLQVNTFGNPTSWTLLRTMDVNSIVGYTPYIDYITVSAKQEWYLGGLLIKYEIVYDDTSTEDTAQSGLGTGYSTYTFQVNEFGKEVSQIKLWGRNGGGFNDPNFLKIYTKDHRFYLLNVPISTAELDANGYTFQYSGASDNNIQYFSVDSENNIGSIQYANFPPLASIDANFNYVLTNDKVDLNDLSIPTSTTITNWTWDYNGTIFSSDQNVVAFDLNYSTDYNICLDVNDGTVTDINCQIISVGPNNTFNSDLNFVAPIQEYWSGDQNIDFNILIDGNTSAYLSIYARGDTNYLILEDANILSGTGLLCDDYNLLDSTRCWFELNTNALLDGNYVFDLNFVSNSDSNFYSSEWVLIDNNAPIISNFTPVNGATTASNVISFDINDILISDVNIFVNDIESTVFDFASDCFQTGLVYSCSYNETGLITISDNNVFVVVQDYLVNSNSDYSIFFYSYSVLDGGGGGGGSTPVPNRSFKVVSPDSNVIDLPFELNKASVLKVVLENDGNTDLLINTQVTNVLHEFYSVRTNWDGKLLAGETKTIEFSILVLKDMGVKDFNLLFSNNNISYNKSIVLREKVFLKDDLASIIDSLNFDLSNGFLLWHLLIIVAGLFGLYVNSYTSKNTRVMFLVGDVCFIVFILFLVI